MAFMIVSSQAILPPGTSICNIRLQTPDTFTSQFYGDLRLMGA